MSGLEDNKPPGMNMHLYSTNPDAIIGENIYSHDRTSINKEESYQTLDNRTVPVDTGEKVNPFNVKGVPGCKECGGSGWKETKKHPHPCNECAKKTVPVIDTYLTKVGHTTQPAVETHMETTTPPVTVQNIRQVEVEGIMPVTREVRYTEDVPVKTQVPVTRYEEIVQNVPVERVDYVTENVPVRTTVPVMEETVAGVPRTQVTNVTSSSYTGPVTTDYAGNYGLTGTTTIPYPVTSEYSYGGMDEVTRNKILTSGQHIHDSGSKVSESYNLQGFVGVPGCKECGGEGWRLSKLTGRKKPCKHCVSITGNCPLCGNTGRILDNNNKCKCQYGKNLP